MIDWAFRDRVRGGYTIAQIPNVSMAIFLAATVARRILQPEGAAGAVLSDVATASLAWWAVDELVRGVNPWRRLLGVGGLAWVAARLIGGT